MTFSRRRVLAALGSSGAGVLAGCSTVEETLSGGPSQQGTPVATLSIPETDATTMASPATVEGRGGGRVGEVSISGGTGTARVHGQSVSALVYRRIPWQGRTGRILYQTLAVAPDALYTVWFYGDDGGTLRDIWVAGTDGTALREESGSGTCDGEFDPTETRASFPAATLDVHSRADAFEVTGENVDIGPDGTGTMTLADVIEEDLATTYDAYAFESVDCTTRCGGEGWYELHLLLSDPDAERALFGILYLSRADGSVRLSYPISLPGLVQPGQQGFDAEWSRA